MRKVNVRLIARGRSSFTASSCGVNDVWHGFQDPPRGVSALAGFEEIRAEPWAERARTELRATGEKVRNRDPGTRRELTPQELQIATLVGEGHSNKDVASQLFLSPRTVEYHLRKVFAKLGISSRAELIRDGAQFGRDAALVL